MKGYFKPKNPKKYNGDVTNIIYRSGLELKFMTYLDSHPEVVKWESETRIVPYISPIDGKYHRYFPDFLVTKLVDGKESTLLIEIKPKKQTKPPTKKKTLTKKYITEVKTWAVNEAKWKSAIKYAKARNWTFLILSEKDLGIKEYH
jgi:hypothetical protein